MADADEATQALIAQMVKEEEQGYDNIYDGIELQPDDSDYEGERRKKKTKKVVGNKKLKLKQAQLAEKDGNVPDGLDQDGDLPVDEDDIRPTAGRKKRKDAGTSTRTAARKWSAEEEVFFLEALELHGRDWRGCADHIGTRDPRAVASHAQKYFIRLCVQGLELPRKVQETGLGYTLSGKLLDPNSAAARQYGLTDDTLKNLSEVASQGVLTDPENQEQHPLPPDMPKPQMRIKGVARYGSRIEMGVRLSGQKAAGEATPSSDGNNPLSGGDKAGQGTQAKGRARDSSARQQNAANEPEEPRQPLTEYARNRPKRDRTGSRIKMGHTTESIDLVQLVDFFGDPGSGGPFAQPFQVSIAAKALLTLDFHAHLSNMEVIGLLGGQWDQEKLHLHVTDAIPCMRVAGTEDRTSVELDPESEVIARDFFSERDLISVGWYHSHPNFEPSPSKKDMDNQRNYQSLFKDETTNTSPFIAIIAGPYWELHKTPDSKISIFVVQANANTNNQLKPYRIRYQKVDDEEIDDDEVRSIITKSLITTIQDPDRVYPNQVWVYDVAPTATAKSGDQLQQQQQQQAQKACTIGSKMLRVLDNYYSNPPPHQIDRLKDYVVQQIRDIWGEEMLKVEIEDPLATVAPGPGQGSQPVGENSQPQVKTEDDYDAQQQQAVDQLGQNDGNLQAQRWQVSQVVGRQIGCPIIEGTHHASEMKA